MNELKGIFSYTMMKRRGECKGDDKDRNRKTEKKKKSEYWFYNCIM